MHATVRRMKCRPGKLDEVADVIETEYMPKLAELDGVVSYTLVQVGENEVTSLAVFANQTAAIAANGLAQMFVNDRLARLRVTDIEVLDGDVMLHAALPS